MPGLWVVSQRLNMVLLEVAVKSLGTFLGVTLLLVFKVISKRFYWPIKGGGFLSTLWISHIMLFKGYNRAGYQLGMGMYFCHKFVIFCADRPPSWGCPDWGCRFTSQFYPSLPYCCFGRICCCFWKPFFPSQVLECQTKSSPIVKKKPQNTSFLIFMKL